MASPSQLKSRPMPAAAARKKSSVPEDVRRILQEGMMLERVGRKDEAAQRHYEHATSARTHSHWQVRQPVYKSSVERWRRYGANLDPLITALGDLAPAGAATGNYANASTADAPVGKSG